MQVNNKIYLLSDPDDWVCVLSPFYPEDVRFRDMKFNVLSYSDRLFDINISYIFLRGNDFCAVGRPMHIWGVPCPPLKDQIVCPLMRMDMYYSYRPMDDSYPYTLDPLSLEMLPLYMDHASEELETILKES